MNRRVTGLVPFLAVLFAPISYAQSGSTPPPNEKVKIENTNADFRPSAVPIPQANPARPTITNPAHLPPTGYLQTEQGFNRAGASPSGTQSQLALSQTTKIALTTRVQVEFLSEPYTYSTVSEQSGLGIYKTSDTGDLLLGVQAIAFKAVGKIPTIAFGYIRRVRAGTAPDLDLGGYVQSIAVLLGGDIGAGFHYDSNFLFNEQNADNVRRVQFGQTLAISHPLFSKATSQRLSGVLELYHFTQPLVVQSTADRPMSHANAVDLLFAATYSLRPNIVADTAFTRGLTSTSTDWQYTLGITYLLPHRLWPDNHPVAKPVEPFKYRNTR
jgi:hypothetical protein